MNASGVLSESAVKLTAVGSGYYRVYDGSGAEVSRHVSEREAVERLTNLLLADPQGGYHYVHDYRVHATADVPAPPAAPAWRVQVYGPGDRLISEHDTWDEAVAAARIAAEDADQEGVYYADVDAIQLRAIFETDPRPIDTPPPPVTGLSDLSDLSGYHVIDVYPTSALKKSGFSGLVWKHPSDTWNPTDETKSASAYIRKYSWKHMDGVAGYEKPIAARFHPGRHEGQAQLQMSSVDPDRPALAFSADLNDPAIMWDNGVEVRGPNVLVQGFVVPNQGHGAGSFELDAYKGQFDPAVWNGRRVVQRFEGCTFNGGVHVQRQGDPQWSGVEIIGCRFNGGRHGAFVKNVEPYQGMPGLILERCLFYRPGSSSTRDHGMYLSHANGVLVRSCIIAEASGSAVKAHASHDVTVIDNLIFGCHSAASPNSNTGSSYGKSTERFVFKNNIVTEMNLGQPAFWMGWSLDGADISNNLFCNTYNPAGNGALFYLAGPFEGTGAGTPTTSDDAQPMRNVRIENNLAFNYTGAFLSIYTDFYKDYPWTMTIRGNKQGQSLDAAMVASWSPGSWSKTQWTQAREGITVTSDNIWADQYDDADRPHLPGHTNGGVSVKDPTFDLAQLNKALGGNASRQAFIDDLPNRDPGLVIDKALKLYREAYSAG